MPVKKKIIKRLKLFFSQTSEIMNLKLKRGWVFKPTLSFKVKLMDYKELNRL